MSNSELDGLLARIKQKYAVETVPLRISDQNLEILQLQDFEKHIDDLVAIGPIEMSDLPYWAKLWDASFLLAYFLGKQPVRPGQRMLEIGAGLGVVGIYAALKGHTVTITDYHEDAILFARANALLNHCPQVEVRKADWRNPSLVTQFDVIVGSEVVYEREMYPALVNFLNVTLAPGGMIFLSKNAELSTPLFFQELTRIFEFKTTTQTVKSSDGDKNIELYAIRRKTVKDVN